MNSLAMLMPCDLQIVKFFEQHCRVDHHAVADDIHGAGVEDARWHDMQLERTALVDDGVAGVVAATIADDQARTLGQQIDDMALAFVTPLGADNRDDRHSCIPF